MAFTDIQNKVGQIQMANRVLLAQKMNPNLTPETDLSGFQEQGGYAPDDDDVDLRDFEKGKSVNEQKQEKANERKQYQKNRQANKEAKRNRAASREAAKREWERRKARGEVFGDMPPDFNLMETLGPSINTLLQIGGAVGGGLRFLTSPLGNSMAGLPYQDGRVPNTLHYNNPFPGSKPDTFIIDQQEKEDARKRFRLFTGIDLAMNFQDAGFGEGGFVSTEKPNIYINSGAEAYILEPNGNFKFDGFYDPVRHGKTFPGLGLVNNQQMQIGRTS